VPGSKKSSPNKPPSKNLGMRKYPDIPITTRIIIRITIPFFFIII
jgi:hypothetical protein